MMWEDDNLDDEAYTEVAPMSRGTNQKFKFSYLMKIMQEKTDDEHSLTMPQIMEELEKYDIILKESIRFRAERKNSLYKR